MDRPLRVLILEDEATDAELMERELHKGGLRPVSRLARTREALVEGLAGFRPDLILSDYHLPGFDGLSALALAKESCPQVPFILVSGPIGEEKAIEILKNGATDYVLKDHLSRLVPAVQRALREAEERAELGRMGEALRAERQLLFSVLEEMPGFVILHAPDHSILFSNQYFRRQFGDPQGKPCYRVMNGLERPCTLCRPFQVLESRKPQEWEWPAPGGRVFQVYAYPFSFAADSPAVLALGIDITRRKEMEKAVRASERQLRRLSTHLLSAQENERKHVAQELHDSIGQILVALHYRTENLLARPPETPPDCRAALEGLAGMIRNAIEETRRIQKNLRPAILDEAGILAAIDWLCRELRGVHSTLDLEARFGLQEPAIPETLKIVLFRVTQEALDNAVKHSRATRVGLALGKGGGGGIELSIRDNGQGFSVEEVLAREDAQRGLGLASMRERVELSGGRFTVESSPGAGTCLVAAWPPPAAGEPGP